MISMPAHSARALGEIPENKQMPVRFTFHIPPNSTNSVQAFINQDYVDDSSMNPGPNVSTWERYVRGVLVPGDGTSKDVFLRPTSAQALMESVEWRLIE